MITTPYIPETDAEAIARANESGLQPVVFVHGLWLLPNSWDRWTEAFEDAGYVALTPSWPDDPETTEEARANPEAFAGKTVGRLAEHHEAYIEALDRKPVIVGHSFGGTLAQILAGRGLAAASVAIDPAPFRGVLPLPIPALKSASAVLRNPANRGRAVELSYDQFRYAFANAVSDDEAMRLYDEFHVPGAGAPIFQAANANLNPFSELKVDTRNPERGPLLIIEGDQDHQVPAAIAKAEYRKQMHNDGV